jgi:hypothetical protein
MSVGLFAFRGGGAAMIRVVLFLLGLALMLTAAILDLARPVSPPTVPIALFRVGLLLAIGSAHWPSGLL